MPPRMPATILLPLDYGSTPPPPVEASSCRAADVISILRKMPREVVVDANAALPDAALMTSRQASIYSSRRDAAKCRHRHGYAEQ